MDTATVDKKQKSVMVAVKLSDKHRKLLLKLSDFYRSTNFSHVIRLTIEDRWNEIERERNELKI